MEYYSRFGTDQERQVADRLASYVDVIRSVIIDIVDESEIVYELRVKWMRKETDRGELQSRLNKLLDNLKKYDQWYARLIKDDMKSEFQSKNGLLFSNFDELVTYYKQDPASLEQKLGSCHSCAKNISEGINQLLGLPTHIPY